MPAVTPTFIFTNENFQPLAGVMVELYNISTLSALASVQTDNQGLATFAATIDTGVSFWARPRITRRGELGAVHIALVDTATAALVATTLFFGVQPSTTHVDATIRPSIMVYVLDQNGEILASDNDTTITLTISTNPGGSAGIDGTEQARNGMATFSNVALNQIADGYILSAAASGLDTITSATFNIVGDTTDPVEFVVGTDTIDLTAGAWVVTFHVKLSHDPDPAQVDLVGGQVKTENPWMQATISDGSTIYIEDWLIPSQPAIPE